jgi:lipopolysaccharide export system protein LptA
MINKKKALLMLATAAICCGMASTALAAPGKFNVKADELEYDLQSGKGLGKGNVIIVQDDGKATANYANFDSKAKTGVLVGKVVVTKGDTQINCETFTMHSEDYVTAAGTATVTKEGKKLEAEQIDYHKSTEYMETVGSWARLTDVDGSTLSAGKIDYDAKSGVANASGGITIDSEARKLTATADKAIYETRANGYVELIGNAKATQDGNSVTGDRLRLTNANVAIADGNVKIIYIPAEKTAQATEEKQDLA